MRPATAAPCAIAEETGEAGSSLGKNADFVGKGVETPLLPAPGNIKAWYLRSHARDILKRAGNQKRIRFCGVKISRGSSGVGVHARPDRAYGRLTGVCVCGQSICCPVCAPRIAAFRAVDVAEGFKVALERGYEARLVTYTLPHSFDDKLGDLLDMISAAWRRMQTSYGRDLRRDSLGNITAQEINWGTANGWHPHKHQLRFDKPGTFDEERHEAAWLASLHTIGRRTRGTDDHAFRVGAVGDEVGAKYISKLSMAVDAEARATGASLELAGGANKGRNIIQLLAAAAGGDTFAASIWFAGVQEIVSRKVTSLRWSRGLRDWCGVGPEKPDEEIAAEEVVETDVYLGEINFHQWRVVVNHRAELALCIAANQGREAVNSFLMGLGAGMLDMERSGPVITDTAEDQRVQADAVVQLAQELSRPDLVIGAEIKRDKDRPSGLSRIQIEAMKG
jgi:hypothetical protein